MAKYNLENYLEKDGLGFPLNFRRGNPNPLDNSSVWKSLELAKNYAETDPTAYVGQILSVVEYTPAVTDDEGAVVTASQSVVSVYYIKDEAGNLEPVGTSPVGDESTVTVAEDGTVSLYGIEGLALTRTDDEGKTTNISYQPLYVNGKLTWVEPSATTVEGLATEIEGLKSNLSDIEGVIGTVEDGKTLSEMIEEAVYDDTDLDERVSAIEEDYLVEADKTDLQGKIDLKADKTALESTDETVAEHTTAIEDLTDRVEAVEGDVATLKGNDTVVGSVDYKIKEAINAFATEVTENDAIDKFAELVDYVANHGGEASEMSSAISTLESEMDTVQGDVSKAKTDIGTNATAISELKTLVGETSVQDQIEAAIEAEDLGQYATDTELGEVSERVAAIEEDYLVEADKTELSGLITENTTKITNVEKDYKAADQAINAVLAEKAAQSDLNNAVDRIAALEEVGAEKNVINSVDTAQFNVDANRNLTLLDVAMGKVTGLSDALAGKVDKVEGSRLITEDEATKIEKLVLGEDGSVSVSGTIAAGNVDGLANWITARAATLEGLSENNFSDALLEKLNGIEAGAQANDIENVSINGVALTISNKTVDIPLATAEKLGVVKSSTAENKVSVDKDGIMEVNSINVNKLVQTEGDTLILNGGAAN